MGWHWASASRSCGLRLKYRGDGGWKASRRNWPSSLGPGGRTCLRPWPAQAPGPRWTLLSLAAEHQPAPSSSQGCGGRRVLRSTQWVLGRARPTQAVLCGRGEAVRQDTRQDRSRPRERGVVIARRPFWTRRMGSELPGVAPWETDGAGARPLALRCRRGPCGLPSGLRPAPCLPQGSTAAPPGQGPSRSGTLGHAGTRAHRGRWGRGFLGFSETRGILGQKLSPRSVSPSGAMPHPAPPAPGG